MARGSLTYIPGFSFIGPFHQSLVAIDPVVFEEKIKM
jgi:hypothetical protein